MPKALNRFHLSPILIGIVIGIFFLNLNSCLFSNQSLSTSNDQVEPYPGMKLIPAKNKTFNQGAIGDLAGPMESPIIVNGFSNNFWMDQNEVTQAEFENLMGWNPVQESSKFGRGSHYPVYSVSWFDAVLYCNARSKKAAKDTVYVYSNISRGASGSVYELEGLSARLEKSGFRLPTEAEWEFAARGKVLTTFAWGNLQDTAAANKVSWYSGNSGNSAHPVAGLRPNSFGLYDMVGNVMEWVNDWQGPYPNLGASDFAGARDPGNKFEKPVKGGAYAYGINQLRFANRSATYTTIPSSAVEYIGFRCVLGSIPNPHFTASDGNFFESAPFTLISNKIPSELNGRSAKLAFINATGGARHLAFVDYGRFPPRVFEFNDINDAAYPAISPNGKWVTFATKLEGAEKGSEIYLRSLDENLTPSTLIGPGFIPRWWVDAASLDTFLIYTNSAVSNSDVRWKTTQTLMQKIVSGKPMDPPTILSPDGGFHDGRSKDKRYLVTGYQNLIVRDFINNSTRTLFTAPENGKVNEDTSQVCNVSISPDSTGRILFLDFGSNDPSSLVGTPYGIHEFAFMANPDGKVIDWYKAPQEELSWDEMEWSNDSKFAVSSARDNADRHRNLYLLNLGNKSIEKLVTGNTLIQPSLWIDPNPKIVLAGGLNLDSLGHYNEPATNETQASFSDKLKRFWAGHNNWELVAFGSSHVELGLSPQSFSRLKAFNFGYPGQGWLGSKRLAIDYALNNCPNLKHLIIEVFPGLYQFPGGDLFWPKGMGQSKGYMYDSSHSFWKNGVPPQFDELMQKSPNAFFSYYDSLGSYGLNPGGWGPIPPIQNFSIDWDTTNLEYRNTLTDIQSFAQLLSDKKIHLWLVNFPESPEYKNTLYYQKYGPGQSTGKAIISDFKMMEKISPYIHFYDAHNFGEHDYSANDAFNEDHLSARGAAKLTLRLDSLIESTR